MWYLIVSIPDLCTLTYLLQACLAKHSLSLYKLTDLTSRYQITLNLTSSGIQRPFGISKCTNLFLVYWVANFECSVIEGGCFYNYCRMCYKVRKRAKIRNRYNQAPHLIQWESDNVTIRHHKREPRGQPFPSR